MRPVFPLFQTPLDLAKNYWLQALKEKGLVVDATAGNGHDTVFLLQNTRDNHEVHSFDIQPKAIESAQRKVFETFGEKGQGRIYWHLASHAEFPPDWKDESIQLLIYNLGYLPGAEKHLTTMTETTLKSVQNALKLMKNGGLISITCYPGHLEGEKEELNLLAFAKTLEPSLWSVSHFRFINREKSPSLLLIQKSFSPKTAS